MLALYLTQIDSDIIAVSTLCEWNSLEYSSMEYIVLYVHVYICMNIWDTFTCMYGNCVCNNVVPAPSVHIHVRVSTYTCIHVSI